MEKDSGRNGECTLLLNCKEKYDLWKRTRKNFPQVCDRIKRTICCPKKIVTTTTVKPNRISEKSKLMNFKHSKDYFYNSYSS